MCVCMNIVNYVQPNQIKQSTNSTPAPGKTTTIYYIYLQID